MLVKQQLHPSVRGPRSEPPPFGPYLLYDPRAMLNT